MSKTGPIVLIDDDPDDAELLSSVLNDLMIQNEFIWFDSTKNAMEYLRTMTGQPFLIICDVNMPLQSGIDFKKELDNDPELRSKAIPFLFYSTSVDKYLVTKAYGELTIQGFFRKEHSYATIKERTRDINAYWKHCEHPSNMD